MWTSEKGLPLCLPFEFSGTLLSSSDGFFSFGVWVSKICSLWIMAVCCREISSPDVTYFYPLQNFIPLLQSSALICVHSFRSIDSLRFLHSGLFLKPQCTWTLDWIFFLFFTFNLIGISLLQTTTFIVSLLTIQA